MVSCYLHDVEQGTNRNAELLVAAFAAATASGCPWVNGLDVQEEPTELLKWAAPIIERSNGTIAAPEMPTHYPGVG